MIFMILVVANAAAQSSYVLFEQSIQTYTVDEHSGNTYAWSVYNISDLTNKITDNSVYEVVSGANTHQIKIKWKQSGNYALIVQEWNSNSCQNMKAMKIEVLSGSPKIQFVNLNSEDCYDGINELITPIKLMRNETDLLPRGNFAINLTYSVQLGSGEKTNYSQTITYENVDDNGVFNLSVSGIIEELNKTKIYTIRIESVTDKYSTPFSIVSNRGAYTRTIHKLPDTGTMVQQ